MRACVRACLRAHRVGACRLRLQEQDFLSRVSFLEDADVFEVYTDLAAQETALQASLQVTSRLLQPTLLDTVLERLHAPSR